MKRAFGGSAYSRMVCLNCMSPMLNARIDKNGGIFAQCDCCKTRSFGLMPKGIAALHFISEALKTTPTLRASLEAHAQAAVDLLYAPPVSTLAPAAAPAAAPAPANGGVA
jgi:hypothetical protein